MSKDDEIVINSIKPPPFTIYTPKFTQQIPEDNRPEKE